MFTGETIKLAVEETGNTVDIEAQNITEKGKAREKKEAGGNKIGKESSYYTTGAVWDHSTDGNITGSGICMAIAFHDNLSSISHFIS